MTTNRLNRPWPLPNKPWIMHQTWNDLLFAHWPIATQELQAIVPASLTIDKFEGQAWIGVVPFWMSGVRPRFIPSIPYLSKFPEINLRTYVTLQGKPGVYFFSLDADQQIAVEAARLSFHLPYFRAKIQYTVSENHIVNYHSTRHDSRANPGQFAATYRPISDVSFSEPGSLEHWLTERYCLYSVDSKETVYRGEIDHGPWPLQLAEADIRMNTLASSFGLQLPSCKPLLHFSKKLNVRAWMIVSCK